MGATRVVTGVFLLCCLYNCVYAGEVAVTAQGHAVELSLEELVHLANKVGMELVEAKKACDRCELMKPIVRARIMLRLDDGQISEAKLRRLMEGDTEYIAYIDKLIETRARLEKVRIRYESYKNLFEARRSMLSYRKAEMRLL